MIFSDFARTIGLPERGWRALRLAVPVILLVLLLRLTGLIEPLGLTIFDAFSRYASNQAASERVVVIGFTETDFAKYPDYPFSDALLAEVLGKVQAGQPSAVLLNLLRDVPVSEGHDALLERYRQMPNLYALAAITPLAREDVPAPPIVRDSDRFGFLQSLPDIGDDTTRLTLLGFRNGDKLLESALLKVVRHVLANGGQSVAIGADDSLSIGDQRLPAITESFGEYQPRLGFQLSEESEEGSTSLLAYSLVFHNAKVPVISFSDILSPEFDTNRLRGRVVLVGNSALSLQRPTETPLTRHSGRGLSGVETNAALINNLLAYAAGEGIGLRSLPEWLEYLLLLLVAWLAIWRFMVYRSLWSGLARGAVLTLAIGAIGYLAFRLGLWLPLGAIAVTLIVAVLVVIDNLLRAASGQRRLVNFMAEIFDRVPEPMFVLDHHRQFRLVNEGFSRLAGMPPVDLVGRPAAEILTEQDLTQGRTTLNAHGRHIELSCQVSNMSDEHGRPLMLSLVRSAQPIPGEDGSESHRAAAMRTALWWADQGRGSLLLATIRILEADLQSAVLGANAPTRIERGLKQRLRSAFPDALDLWATAPGELALLLARGDGAFDQDRLLQLLRQSLSWALRIDDQAIELDVAIGVAPAHAGDSVASLQDRARAAEVEMTVG